MEIKRFTLLADVPQKLPGNWTAIKVISGADVETYITDTNPIQSQRQKYERRLDTIDEMHVGPFKNAWVTARAISPQVGAGELIIACFDGPGGVTESSQSEMIGEHIFGSGDSEVLPGAAYNSLGTLTPQASGAGRIHKIRHGFLSGMVMSTELFTITACAKTLGGDNPVIAATLAKQWDTGEFVAYLDFALWDHTWGLHSLGTPTALVPTRLVIPTCTQFSIFARGEGAGGSISYRLGARTR